MGPSGRGEAIRRQRASVSRWLPFRALPPTRTLQENPRWSHLTKSLVEDIRTIPEGAMWRVREAKHIDGLLDEISRELRGSWLRDWADEETRVAGALPRRRSPVR